jgi:thiol:disulfide interchange protein
VVPSGKLNVYTGKVVVRVPVEVKADAKVGSDVKVTGVLKYQICNEESCFQPADHPFEAKSTIVAPSTEVKPNEADLFKESEKKSEPEPKAATAPTTGPTQATAPPVVVDDDSPKWSVPLALGTAFLAGILFNLVPCVLPVLPIKVLGFAEVAQHDRGKTILL